MRKNPFTLLEYDPIKLLNSPEKVTSIFEVRDGKSSYDDRYPVSVELHLTDICNLKCPWCTDLEIRQAKASQRVERLDLLFKDLAKQNVGVTVEGGGEPTVHKQFPEIIEKAKSYGLDLGLITNGVRPLVELSDAFKWIRVSIDATNEEEYKIEKGVQRFDKVIENLQALGQLKDRDFLLGVGYVITNRNSKNLPSFMRHMDELGVDYLYLRPVEEAPDIMPDLKWLYEVKSDWESNEAEKRRLKVLMNLDDRIQKNNEGLPCIAHSLSCVIQANGDVVMCEKRRHDPIVFGNINESSFDDIWKSDFRKEVSQKLLNPKNQQGCEVCRITKFNRFFTNLGKLKTERFI